MGRIGFARGHFEQSVPPRHFAPESALSSRRLGGSCGSGHVRLIPLPEICKNAQRDFFSEVDPVRSLNYIIKEPENFRPPVI